jgi:hypothetical protein
MRTYCIDYTNSHDQTLYDQIMEPDYVVHINGMDLTRDESYAPLVTSLFEQAPGLGLVVHDFVLNGDRLCMCFSEHGAMPTKHGLRLACWRGIGLYKWNGRRLTENYVEQDYLARRRQLAEGRPDPVEPPAVAPWDTRSVRADLAAEEVVRAWLDAGDLSGVTADDGRPPHRPIAVSRTDVGVLFSAGPRVAFHAVQHGPLTGEDPRFAGDGEAMLHLAGIVRVEGGRVAGGRVIRDRLGLLRRLVPREPREPMARS